MGSHLRAGHSGWRKFAACVAVCVSTACYSTNSYRLKLDAAKDAQSELCERSSDNGTETCKPLAGQALEAPGALAVQIVNTDASKSYTLRIEEATRGSARPRGRYLAYAFGTGKLSLSRDNPVKYPSSTPIHSAVVVNFESGPTSAVSIGVNTQPPLCWLSER